MRHHNRFRAPTFSATSATGGVTLPQLAGSCCTPNKRVIPDSMTTTLLGAAVLSRVTSFPFTRGLKAGEDSEPPYLNPDDAESVNVRLDRHENKCSIIFQDEAFL
jgi:hypothetical protein